MNTSGTDDFSGGHFGIHDSFLTEGLGLGECHGSGDEYGCGPGWGEGSGDGIANCSFRMYSYLGGEREHCPAAGETAFVIRKGLVMSETHTGGGWVSAFVTRSDADNYHAIQLLNGTNEYLRDFC